MKGLVFIHASVDFQYYPYFIIDIPDATTEEELAGIVADMLPSHFDHDAESVRVDGDGVCWVNGNCWYVQDTNLISDEDAAHIERILGISTL